MLPSKCHLLFYLSLAQIIFIFCLILPSAVDAEETKKVQANSAASAKTAEQRERDMLENSVKPFFKVNNVFLDVVQPNPLQSRVLMDVVANLTSKKQWTFLESFELVRPLVIAYPGYVALLLFGLLLFILIPIIGVFWCSCRCCCHRCGARTKPMDGRYARCRRGTFGVILGILCTLVLAGSVLAFISNDLLHRPFLAHSPDNPVTELNSSLTKITDNMESISRSFNNETLQILTKKVPEVKKAVKNASAKAEDDIVRLTDINGLVSLWSSISQELTKYKTASDAAKANSSNFLEAYSLLLTNSSVIINSLKETFNSSSCFTTECSSASTALENFAIQLNASKINFHLINVTTATLEAVNVGEISVYLSNASTTLHNISAKITETGGSQINELVAKLNDSKKIEAFFTTSEAFVTNLTTRMRHVTNIFNNKTILNNKKLRPVLAELDEYRMYGLIGVASTVLLIVFFYYLGLCFGACGEPPYEDARFCNRGVGATLMSCGVGFTFLFFPLVMLTVMVTFLIGAPTRTEVCRYLLNERPNGSQILDSEISVIFKQLNITLVDGYSYPPNLIEHVMGDCKNNTSIVDAFGLNSLINGGIIYNSEVKPSLTSLKEQIKAMDLNVDITKVKTQAANFVDRLKVSIFGGKTKPFDPSIAELRKDVVTGFEGLPLLLKQGDESMNWSIGVNSSIDSLTNLIQSVNSSKTLLLDNLETLKTVGNLESMMNTLREKSETLNGKVIGKKVEVKKIIDTAFDALDKTVKGILINAVDTVLSEHASCQVLHEQATTIVNLFCKNILNPFNGFWLGIGWCLLILIPSMIFACKLNYLYRKTEYYVKDYEEPDYMSYQGFYPSDSIPLERGSSGMKLLGASKTENYV